MKNHKELFEALAKRETLTHDLGDKCWLDEDGYLQSRLSKFGPFFSNPSAWRIYEPPKWYENIPEGGILCWCGDDDDLDEIRIIIKNEDRFIDSDGLAWDIAKPIKKSEINFWEDFEEKE